MFLPLLEVGYGNYIFTSSVIMLINPLSKPARRMITKAKKEETFIDLTLGNAGACLLLLDTGEIIMSSIDVKTIMNRYMKHVNNADLNKDQKLEPFLEIGYKNYILPYKVTGLYTPKSKSISTAIKNAKNTEMLIDCKQGRETRSVIFVQGGYVIASAITPDTIRRRYMNAIKKINNNEIDVNDIIEDDENE